MRFGAGSDEDLDISDTEFDEPDEEKDEGKN
jgi:hypothetical protein